MDKKILGIILVIFISLILFYLIIQLITFQKCDFKTSLVGVDFQKCSCIGIKKYVSNTGSSYSECVGIPFNYGCYNQNFQTREIEKINDGKCEKFLS